MRRAAFLILPLVPGLLLLEAASLSPRGAPQEYPYADLRQWMVRADLEGHGIRDSLTLHAMRAVPRHEFVRPQDRGRAYGDHALPLTHGQTISQPYIVGYMTEQLEPRRGMRVLEIGTGSGYQAAVLAETGAEVFTVEIIGALADAAAERLRRLGYESVRTRHADGFFGWEEAAPFDAIIVTAAPGFIPPPLLEQLSPGGQMVIPVGSLYGTQNLVMVRKTEEGDMRTRTLIPVRFVPFLRGIR